MEIIILIFGLPKIKYKMETLEDETRNYCEKGDEIDMLTLPIKKKWFDMILSGEKKEEYREIKPYYTTRFYGKAYEYNVKKGFVKEYDKEMEIILRNGYSSDSPTIKCKVKITKGYGKEEWGAEPNELYYVLKILSAEEVK